MPPDAPFAAAFALVVAAYGDMLLMKTLSPLLPLRRRRLRVIFRFTLCYAMPLLRCAFAADITMLSRHIFSLPRDIAPYDESIRHAIRYRYTYISRYAASPPPVTLTYDDIELFYAAAAIEIMRGDPQLTRRRERHTRGHK